MIQQLKLVISEDGKVIEKLTKDTDTDPSILYESLEEFRLVTNAALTKVVERTESSDKDVHYEDSSSENEEVVASTKAKRRKKKISN